MTAIFEKYAPITAAALITLALVYFKERMVAGYVSKEVDFASLYSSVLNWSAIQTGFIFGVFGFVAGKNEGFIAAVRNTEEMRLFARYMRTAMYLGFGITLSSIVMMVINYSIASGTPIRYSIFCAWAFFSIWSFFAFVRVAYVFGILIRPKDKVRIPG